MQPRIYTEWSIYTRPECYARCNFLDLPVQRFCDSATISPTLEEAYSFPVCRGRCKVVRGALFSDSGDGLPEEGHYLQRTNQHKNKVRHQEHRETRTIRKSGKSGKYILVKDLCGQITNAQDTTYKGQKAYCDRSLS